MLNGSPHGRFSPFQGIYQGDSISPYLFILCSKVLTKILIQAKEQGLCHEIKIAHSTP